MVFQGRHKGSKEDRKTYIKVVEMTSYPGLQRHGKTFERIPTSEERHIVLPWRDTQKMENYSFIYLFCDWLASEITSLFQDFLNNFYWSTVAL